MACNTSHSNKMYEAFVVRFAIDNNMKIYRDEDCTLWTTVKYEFNTPEDELMFKLKYDHEC